MTDAAAGSAAGAGADAVGAQSFVSPRADIRHSLQLPHDRRGRLGHELATILLPMDKDRSCLSSRRHWPFQAEVQLPVGCEGVRQEAVALDEAEHELTGLDIEAHGLALVGQHAGVAEAAWVWLACVGEWQEQHHSKMR